MRPLDNDHNKVEVLRLVNEGYSFRQIEEKTGISRSALNSFILRKSYKEWWANHEKPIAAGEIEDHRARMKRLKGDCFILTSAQNSTFVHDKFLRSLESAADYYDAQLIVGTFSYNINGFQNLQKSEGEWFDPKIKDYILDEPAIIADGLIWCGELNILPTAVNPLSGLHSYTKSASGIIPHAKVQLESLPTHKQEPCKMLYTTGTVTKRNYIQKKSGQKASFHHVFGALLVEVDEDGDWFVRQLIADSDTGSFYDLNVLFTPNGAIEDDDTVEAINWGDVHAEKSNTEVTWASFDEGNPDNMLDTLCPKYQFIHDVIDFTARNHHNINDPYFRFRAYVEGKDSVKDNVDKVSDFLLSIERDETLTVVVESNHDLAFERWLKEADYKNDPANAIFFLENQLEIYKAIEQGKTRFSVFENAVRNSNPSVTAKFLRIDESFKICDEGGEGIECGSHGHLGANGSRGSISLYQKLGTRYNIGHTHSASIKDGVYCAGVSANLDMGYNKGASSWSNSHIVTYVNGKRTIITIKNGKWRA